MLKLANMMSPARIQVDMQASDKNGALEELLGLFIKEGTLEDTAEVMAELLEREKSVSTGIGDGIAIPHKLTRRATRTMIAFGCKKDGLDFAALDQEPVYLLFLIIGPPRKVTEHLQVLSKLSRLLHNQHLRQQLHDAQQPDEVLDIIRQYENV